jgi:hemoglobin/transferrin/lactoferrin receptor protein
LIWRRAGQAALCGAAIALPAPAAFGQPAGTPRASSPAAAGSAVPSLALDQITVTATRNPVRAFEFPGMVTPVLGDEVAKTLGTNPRDIFFSVPGLSYGGGGRRTGQIPSIRGFSGPDIQVNVDGGRQDWVTAHDGRFFIDPQLLRRTDVVRGPTSAVYGSGGLGGVIAFETLDPGDLLGPDGTVAVRTSRGFQTYQGEWSFGAGAAWRPFRNFSVLAYGVGRNSGNILLPDGTKQIAKDQIRSGLLKAVYDDGEFKAKASYLAFTNRPLEPGNPQILNPTSTFPLIRRDVSTGQLTLETRWAPAWSPLIDVGVLLYQVTTRNSEKEFSPRPEFTRQLRTQGFVIDNRSRFMIGKEIGVTLNVGLEGTRNDFSTNAAQGVGQNNGTPAGKTNLVGAFVQGEMVWSSPLGLPGKLTLAPGLRYDTYRSENANNRENKADAISPRVGLSYAPVEWGFVFANVGRAFRAPTLTELYADGIHFRLGAGVVNRFVPNTDLLPQTAVSYEAGFGLRFNDVVREGDAFRFKASLYRSDVNNLISTAVRQPPITNPLCFSRPLPACAAFNGTTAVINVGKAELSGFELEGRYDAGLFYVAGNMFTVNGKNKVTGGSAGTLAPLIARLDGGVRLFQGQLTLGARATFASKFDKGTFPDNASVDPAQTRPGYSVWDVYARINPRIAGLEGLSIDLGVDNLFSRRYAVVAANAIEPARNFRGLISYTRTW